MVRQRIFGSDADFMRWVRSRGDLFPSSSNQCAYVASDVDTLWHQYKTVVDGQGTREVQAIMFLEVKTRSGQLTPSQQDTLFKFHKSIKPSTRVQGALIRNLGVSVVYLDGKDPDDSLCIQWGRFNEDGKLRLVTISYEQFIALMQFELHPDTLQNKTPFRRHHKETAFIALEETPLGFTVERLVRMRS